ncbi:hypothetical protein MUK42_36104 [Musa troglodytarum]|uniref:Uncharacterized protein n=1 Tax=Musa troglodytarum TaxID=320322 RepID=A0A9E7GIQ9_9LILI|nr:hypothetical protein MUK42_36104 [Musa troglodytarum]
MAWSFNHCKVYVTSYFSSCCSYGSDNSDMKKQSSLISNLKKRNRDHEKKTSKVFSSTTH